jgi:hypothetical protein
LPFSPFFVSWLDGFFLHSPMDSVNGYFYLPPFTFPQVGVRWVEFQALPGRKSAIGGLRAKTMWHTPFLGPGGQAVLSPRAGLLRGWGARPGARWARHILRKHGGSPDEILLPPMLFPRDPPMADFRATSLPLTRKETRQSEGGQAISIETTCRSLEKGGCFLPSASLTLQMNMPVFLLPPRFPKGEKAESSTADPPEALLPLKKGGREGFLGKPFQNAKVLPKKFFKKGKKRASFRRKKSE